jgi:hypothetical protein
MYLFLRYLDDVIGNNWTILVSSSRLYQRDSFVRWEDDAIIHDPLRMFHVIVRDDVIVIDDVISCDILLHAYYYMKMAGRIFMTFGVEVMSLGELIFLNFL